MTDNRDKIIEKLKEHIEYLIDCFHNGFLPLSHKIDNFESEIASLEQQVEREELDVGWKELENSGLDKPFVPPQIEQKENPVYDENYLNECIEKARPNLSKIKDVDKWLDEVRGVETVSNEKLSREIKRNIFIVGYQASWNGMTLKDAKKWFDKIYPKDKLLNK